MATGRLGSSRRAWIAGAVMLVVALASGCGDPAPDLPEPGERAGASPDPLSHPDEDAILAGYENFLRVRDEAYNLGDPDHPDLAVYAGGEALINLRENIETNNQAGARYEGSAKIVWAEVGPSDYPFPLVDPFTEVIQVTACLDVSEFIPVRIEDGSSMLREGAEQGSYLGTADLFHHSTDDRWVVMATTFDWEAPC